MTPCNWVIRPHPTLGDPAPPLVRTLRLLSAYLVISSVGMRPKRRPTPLVCGSLREIIALRGPLSHSRRGARAATGT
jgi:hypothetical protein